MDYTKNYNLKKPSNEDFYNVEDFNSNVETVDNELKKVNDKADKIEKQQINKIELEEILSSQNILKKIKEVDGAGSGLDADTVDGLNTGYHPNNTFIPNVYGSVLEIGKYIDFHEPGSNKDFDGRLSLNNKYPYWQPDSGAVSRVALADGTLQTNLNADLLDGKDSSDFRPNITNIGKGNIDDYKNFGTFFFHPNSQNMPLGMTNYYSILDNIGDYLYGAVTQNLFFPQLNKQFTRSFANNIFSEWKEVGNNLFTVPRQFNVTNVTADQTVFSYSGGAGEFITATAYNTSLTLVVDGATIRVMQFPYSGNSGGTPVEYRICFKNSIVLKAYQDSQSIVGLVMTEK